jgi:murein DD-endopeptidase MepM/ murein hydrolase activator NlpD
VGHDREVTDRTGSRPPVTPAAAAVLPLRHEPHLESTIYAATPGKRAARADHPTAASRVDATASTYVGRRMAPRPVDAPSATLGLLTLDRSPASVSRAAGRPDLLDTGTINRVLAGLEPADQTTSFVGEITAAMPLVDVPAPSVTVCTPGKRRAVKVSSRRRGPLFRGLPSAPLLLGFAALAVSAGGAIAAGQPAVVDSNQAGFTQASALNGIGGTGSVGTKRDATASRDSARGALAESAPAPVPAPVEAAAVARTGKLSELGSKAERYVALVKANQWQVPLDSYRLTARFGQYGLWASYHTGLDFAAPSGTPIHAIANGVVTSAGYDGSYGNKTVVTLDDGTELWYCHQTAFAVSVGDTVQGGETIGYVGSTGNVTGPHVHIEVRPGGGDPIDPYQAFIENGVQP